MIGELEVVSEPIYQEDFKRFLEASKGRINVIAG